MRRASSIALLILCLVTEAAGAACKGSVYLTIDTGNMEPAEAIATILNKHAVRATFFLANEPTKRGDFSLDRSWTEFWRARVNEGHAFGNHTWRHWYFRRDVGDDKVAYVGRDGTTELLDQTGFCTELKRVDHAFEQMTGRRLDPIWRAPGGRLTPRALKFAQACGYPKHVHWSDAGFLGDELPSDKHPNEQLLKRALANVKAGDILMMHLGIWSRKEPFWPMLDPLIAGLKSRGMCFEVLGKAGDMNALVDAFTAVQGVVFEQAVLPALYALGLMDLSELAFDATESVLLGLLQIGIVFVLLRPLEAWIPAERWQERVSVRTDVLYTFLNRVGVVPIAIYALLTPPMDALDAHLRMSGFIPPGLEDLIPGLANSVAATFLVYLLVLDLADYWRHRLQHRFAWWWALHSLHHSQRQMTFWNDDRNHLLDDLIAGVWFALIALLIGVPPEQFVAIVWFTRFVESLSHANVRFGFGALGERLLVSPRFHRTHHAIGVGHQGRYYGCNFATLFPAWDVVFGTANFSYRGTATGVADQLTGHDYGETFLAQQRLGIVRMARALAMRQASEPGDVERNDGRPLERADYSEPRALK